MNTFAVNLLFALVWGLATGSLSEVSLIVGFLVGMGVLHVAGMAIGDRRYVVRIVLFAGLFLTFVWELIVSSVRVAITVLTPGLHMRPAVVAVPLDVTRDVEITLLANLITLTPGTLTIDVANDRSCLYVHAMHGENPDEVAADIKRTFERRIMEAFR